jgi:hypothetical protein
MALGKARSAGVLRRHGEHVRPFERREVGLGVALRDGDAEKAVPRGDVEDTTSRTRSGV